MTDTNQEVRETPEWGDVQSNAIPDLPSKIACEIMALPWTHGGTEDEHAYRYGELQELVEAALASTPPPAVPDAVGVRDTFTEAEAVANQLRGSLSREDEDGAIVNPADIIRRAVAALSSIEPTPSPEPQAYYDAILSCLDRYQPMAEKAERRDLVEFMDQLRDEIGNRAPLCKLNRWLGYIQGVLIENGHTDVLIERDWSRPLFRPLDYGERLIGYALPEDVYTGGPRSVPLETWQNNSLFEGLFTQPVYSNVSHEPQASNAGAVTDDQVYRAALAWCSEKDRETSQDDILYFQANWRVMPGLRAYVERECAALSTPEPQTGERDGGMADVSIRSLLASSHAEADHWKRKYETEHALHVGAIRERNAAHEAAERRLAEVEERAREDAARLDWMEANPGAELAKVGGWDESDDYRWAVHIVRGGRNDREWNEIASGATARAALDAALRAKPEAQAIVGKEAQS